MTSHVARVVDVEDVARVPEARERPLGRRRRASGGPGWCPPIACAWSSRTRPVAPTTPASPKACSRLAKSARVDGDVVVEEDKDVAGRRADAGVPLRRDAGRRREVRHVRPLRPCGLDHGARRSLRVAVHDEQLGGGWVGGEDARKRLAENLGPAEGGDHDRKPHRLRIVGRSRITAPGAGGRRACVPRAARRPPLRRPAAR